MPAYFTHYLYGRMNYRRMKESELKRMIRKHREVYALGLAGPDIFFYYLPDHLMLKELTGSILHEQECGAFLRRMLTEMMRYSGDEKEIAAAYLAGFLGHYRLDHACHPYIYQYVEREAKRLGTSSKKEENAIHFRLECALDHYFLKHYLNKTAKELSQRKITSCSRKERRVISRLLSDSYNKTYPIPNLTQSSVRSVLLYVRIIMLLIHDPCGRKEKLWNRFFALFGKEFMAEGLFVNDNCYGIGQEEWEKVNRLFLDAMKNSGCEYEKMAAMLEQGLDEEEINRRRKSFGKNIGNWSYHTEGQAKKLWSKFTVS